jgi:hypothetical protein
VVSRTAARAGLVLRGRAIWASRFTGCIFSDFESAFYFALVSYTPGYGDSAARTGAPGAMARPTASSTRRLLTTLLIEGLGHVRAGYHRSVHGEDPD